MLASDDMASLYQYRFLCGGYLQKKSKRAAEYKITFSVFNTWFQYHLERKPLIWQVC